MDIYTAFDGLWVEIPTPFKKGDILIGVSKYWTNMKPFVLEHIPYWVEDERDQRLVERLRDYGDVSDLITSIFGQEEDGTIYRDHGPNYLHLEYYDQILEGTERILTTVSNYLKGDLELELLLRAYDLLKRESYTQKERHYLKMCFTDEGCIKAGLQAENKNIE